MKICPNNIIENESLTKFRKIQINNNKKKTKLNNIQGQTLNYKKNFSPIFFQISHVLSSQLNENILCEFSQAFMT